MVVFFSATAILLYVSAVGIYYFEHEAQPEHFQSIIHSLWWAVIKLTTVGYGDVYPITMGGKLFTFVILMCGLGIVAIPAGLIASLMSKVRQAENRKNCGNRFSTVETSGLKSAEYGGIDLHSLQPDIAPGRLR